MLRGVDDIPAVSGTVITADFLAREFGLPRVPAALQMPPANAPSINDSDVRQFLTVTRLSDLAPREIRRAVVGVCNSIASKAFAGAASAALGSFAGPVGAVVGAYIGEKVGGSMVEGFGNLFGGQQPVDTPAMIEGIDAEDVVLRPLSDMHVAVVAARAVQYPGSVEGTEGVRIADRREVIFNERVAGYLHYVLDGLRSGGIKLPRPSAVPEAGYDRRWNASLLPLGLFLARIPIETVLEVLREPQGKFLPDVLRLLVWAGPWSSAYDALWHYGVARQADAVYSTLGCRHVQRSLSRANCVRYTHEWANQETFESVTFPGLRFTSDIDHMDKANWPGSKGAGAAGLVGPFDNPWPLLLARRLRPDPYWDADAGRVVEPQIPPEIISALASSQRVWNVWGWQPSGKRWSFTFPTGKDHAHLADIEDESAAQALLNAMRVMQTSAGAERIRNYEQELAAAEIEYEARRELAPGLVLARGDGVLPDVAAEIGLVARRAGGAVQAQPSSERESPPPRRGRTSSAKVVVGLALAGLGAGLGVAGLRRALRRRS